MKQHAEVRAFKNELMNYYVYKERITKLNNLIEYCYHMLGGIKGIDTTKEPSQSHIKNLDAEYKIRDEIELHTRKIERTQNKINEIEQILNSIEALEGEWVRLATFKVFAQGYTYAKVGETYGYSPSNVRYIVNRAIKKALDI